MRVRAVGASQDLAIRVIAISKLPTVTDATDLPPSTAPSWDMSAAGSEKWIRLMCGFEIQAKAAVENAEIGLLITRDETPLTCNQ